MSREPTILPRGSSGYVTTADGLQLHYLEYGQDGGDVPALVVVPGITSPAITWEFVSEALAQDARVVTLDVRGRGFSDRGPEGSYSLPSYAADLAALVKSLGGGRPIVLGHSMGARIAAAFGVLYPGLAQAMIVCDPPLTGPGRAPYPTPLDAFVTNIRDAQAGASGEGMRPLFPTWTDEQLELRADWLATCDEGAIIETYENFEREDFFAFWRELPAPLLFLYGARSPAVPEEAVPEVAAANPAAEVAGVADAGHMIPWDNLDGFLVEVRRFLERYA